MCRKLSSKRVAPPHHPQRHFLLLLEEALRRDIHFIDRHPTTLFQCLWNSCWWYDCPEVAKYRETSTATKPPRPIPPCALGQHSAVSWELAGYQEAANAGVIVASVSSTARNAFGTAQLSVMRGDTGWVTCAVPSPDGRRFASASSRRVHPDMGCGDRRRAFMYPTCGKAGPYTATWRDRQIALTLRPRYASRYKSGGK